MKGQLEIRGAKANALVSQVTEAIPKPVAAQNVQVLPDPRRIKNADIDFFL